MINFPEDDKRFIQTNRSDIIGNLWSTFNLDFQSNLGAVRVSPRLLVTTLQADAANLGCAVGFVFFDAGIWTVAGTRVFRNSGVPNGNFIEDSSTNFATDFSSDYSDIEVYAGELWATTTDDLMSKVADGSNTGAWTTGRMSLSTGIHRLTYFKKFDRLYVTDLSNRIKSIKKVGAVYTTATSGDYFINLGEDSNATFISCTDSTSTDFWIGIIDLSNKAARGKILQWDGISAQITNEFILDANGCMALVVDNDIPYAMDSNGCFLKYNGSSFEEVTRLPISVKRLLKNVQTNVSNRFIHPKGIVPTKNGTFLAFVNNENGDNGQTVNENFAAGVYEIDPDNGATHRYSLSYTPINTSTITDFGQVRLSRVGGIANVPIYSTSSNRNGFLLLGATYFTNASSTTNGIFTDDSNDTVQKKGYFVTTFMEEKEAEEQFGRLWAFFKRFRTETDKITFKYRTTEMPPVEATITWTSTTTFTTTTNVSAYGIPDGENQVGYEAEILRGTGSGSCCQITSVTENAGTYTVTVEDAVTGVTSGTATARFQKWIKLGEIAYDVGSVQSYQQLPMESNDTRIQIKGCLTFTGEMEFYKHKLKSDSNIDITD